MRPVHFCFKECWVVFFLFIQIIIEHSVGKQWRIWPDAAFWSGYALFADVPWKDDMLKWNNEIRSTKMSNKEISHLFENEWIWKACSYLIIQSTQNRIKIDWKIIQLQICIYICSRELKPKRFWQKICTDCFEIGIMSDFWGHRVFVSHSARTLPVF